MLDLSTMKFADMADIVRAIRDEVDKRPERELYLSKYWRSMCNQVIDSLESIPE